jgi:hypothetical protein
MIVGVLLAGCVPPMQTSSPAAAYVYVAGSAAGTVTQLERETGRPTGPPVSVGAAPTQLVAGPDQSLLALSTWPAAPLGADRLTHAVRSGGGWHTRPIDLGSPAHDALLAGDGGRHALVVYHPDEFSAAGPPPTGPPCRLAVVDVAAGTVERTLGVCGRHERVAAVALASGPDGRVAYLGIWHAPDESGTPASGRSRVVAIDAVRGVVLAVAPLAGFPSDLAYVPGRSPGDERLYCLEHVPFPSYDTSDGARSQLLALNPDTLQIERELPLRDSPLHLAMAPDGDHVYALISGGSALMQLSLTTGVEGSPISLPGQGYTLAVTEAWVYVSYPKGDAVWLLDRSLGAIARTVHVSGRPTGLAQSTRA